MSNLRKALKRMIWVLGLGKIIGISRRCKYAFIDAIGTVFFAILRILKKLPKKKTSDGNFFKNILIVRNDRVGDLILSTPALRAVRNKYFNSTIHLLVSKYAEDLVVNNSSIDKILTDEKEILNTKYDLAISLSAGYKQNELLFKSRAERRIGFSGFGGGFFLTEEIKDERRKNPQHEIDFSLSAAQKVGADINNKKLEISITSAGERFAEKFYENNNLKGMIIVVHPGARQENLRWSRKGFAELSDLLSNRFKVTIILTGTLEEKEIIDAIAKQMKNKPLTCLDLKLTELVSILKRASMYIGNITGPMHIACAVNIPVVAITGLFNSLDDIRYWGPRCDNYEIVRKQGLESIIVDDVYQAVLRLAGKNVA